MLTQAPLATPRIKRWPGYTLNRVGPSDWMRSCTDFCAPDPNAIIVITAPTPMMMPSMVSRERSLFARSASRATTMISPSSMALPRRATRQHEHRVLLGQAARHFDVVLVGEAGVDFDFGVHPRFEQVPGVRNVHVDRKHGHVLVHLRLGLDLQDAALELTIGVRVDGDGHRRPRPHLADVGLVHERRDLDGVEV